MIAAEPNSSPIGRQIGHYQVLSLLGAGGMGEVYLAQDTRLGRKIALKLLPAQFTQDADRLRRFEQEARAASALNHPNIITIHEIGQIADLHFMATEFIDGQTLRQRMAREPMKLGDALEVAMQVASALQAAHAAGVVHRDIKPENIMLRTDGYVKVLDFGLAKLTETTAASVDTGAATAAARANTETGVVMGTLRYMSPEQARGVKMDARTDIFSLGVVLYEMITGHAPFEGETASDVMAAILKTEPLPLTDGAREVPGKLEHLVSRALRKDREERYQVVTDLLLDLKDLKQELELEARSARQSHSSRPIPSMASVAGEVRKHHLGFAVAWSVLLLAAIGLGYWFFAGRASRSTPIESIAVLPFVNESGNADVEYLSDGMTESLINSLSQLPHLLVKARSSVFRYKGKEVGSQQVATELSVQAILNGRFVLRGDDLVLYLSLVDGRNGNQLWGEQYPRKLKELVALQSEITRDVSQKLRARLSSADEQRLAKNYTANTEAYQLYLKGRYHLLKLTPPEIQTGLLYFQQAIAIDPSYALAYVGLADGYRSFALVGEMPSSEFFPKAKAAANKAIAIDDRLAEAHAELGFTIFWYDWDWNAAENQLQRALELNPNNADTHLFYAHLLSNTGRHTEGLAEVKRARELDPLDLRINGLEAQFLIHAGKSGEALALLQNTLELNPNNWFAHMFASSAYIEKGMFAEAAVEARKARELNGANSQTTAQLGYALAKSGKQAEARGLLEELLKLSTQRYISPGNIALIYNGLGEREETLIWLERSYERRDSKMVFLKVEPKWNNLRDDPRFQDLLRRVGFRP